MKKSRSQSGFLCGDDVPLFVCSFLRLSPTRTDGGGGLSRRPFAQNNRCRDIKFPPKSLSPETFATFKSLLRRIMYGTKVTPQLFPAPSVKKFAPEENLFPGAVWVVHSAQCLQLNLMIITSGDCVYGIMLKFVT